MIMGRLSASLQLLLVVILQHDPSAMVVGSIFNNEETLSNSSSSSSISTAARSASSCTDPIEFTRLPNSYSTSEYILYRGQCTDKCNADGYCCTLGMGGCNYAPCNEGCHIAFFSENLTACKAQCTRANNDFSCDYTHSSHEKVGYLGFYPWWPNVGVGKCWGSKLCGCPTDETFGNDCSDSACERGCELAYETDIRDNFFKGEDAIIDPNIGLSASDLRAAITAIQSHVDGSSTLSNVQLRSAWEKFKDNSEYLDMDFDSMDSAFNLVDTYESRYGGLFINSRSDKYGFKQEDSDDGYTLERIILTVQQAILDEVYQGTLNHKAYQTRIHDPIVENCKDYLRGRYWKTSTYFPGFVDLPAQQSNVVHSVDIDATVNQYWGKRECFSSSPTIHATGLYVPPGGVAWINVPSVLVDKGFQIQVGANDVDTIIKDNQLRMDRITCTYEVTTSKTYVSSPLGGGIYIKVPYLSNFGVQSMSISGDVIEAPFLSMTSLKTTTEAEWNVLKDSKAPWADFESYYYMQNVPTSWISEFDFDHVKTLLEGRDAIMKGINYIGGFPNDKRNQQVLYLQPDVHIRHGSFGVGYPQVNSLVSTGKNGIEANPNHSLVSDPFLLDSVELHERGHCMFFSESFYRGEIEAIVNFPYAYAMSVAGGQTLEYAFSYSMGGRTGILTPDMASVDWMVTINFREGNEMETDSPQEFQYQPRGYAKYADLCTLFGCEVLHKFFYQEHLDHMAGDPNFFKPEDYDFNDFRTLRLSIQAGVDLTPLMHYWGIHPVDSAKLQASMNENNLKVSIDVFNLITYRLGLIPKNRDEFLAFFRNGWPGKENPEPWECQWQWSDCGLYLYWLDKWDETISNQARAAGQAILDLYYNIVPTPTSAPITPTPPTDPPTPTPPTPSNSCTDSTLRFRVKNKSTGKFITRNCKWVQAKPFRCSWDGVTSHCQSTCTNGCPSCQDATLKFKVMLGGKKRSKKCTWVAKRATTSRCKNEGVRETCRKTCKEC